MTLVNPTDINLLIKYLEEDPKALSVVKASKTKETDEIWFFRNDISGGGKKRQSGWVTFNDAMIMRGPPDPSDLDNPGNKWNNSKQSFAISQNSAPILFKFCDLFEKQWNEQINILGEKGIIDLSELKTTRLVRRKYSKKNKHNPGGEIADPLVRFKVSFKRYSDKYFITSMRNEKVTQILDYRKTIIENGVEKYAEFLIDGNPVNESNLFLALNHGTIIKQGRFSYNSTMIVAGYITCTFTINKMVILPDEKIGFSDDFIISKPILNDETTTSDSVCTESNITANKNTELVIEKSAVIETHDNKKTVKKTLNKLGEKKITENKRQEQTGDDYEAIINNDNN